MAIYIDIIARLDNRQLIKQGEEVRDYMATLEKEIRDRQIKGAQGANRKLIKLEDQVTKTRDRQINTTDALISSMGRLEEAAGRVSALRKQTAKDEETQKKLDEARIAAEREEAYALQDLVIKLQAMGEATRQKTAADKDLNDETKLYKKNVRDVTRITKTNRKELTQLSRTTNKLRNETESLRAANLSIVQDNKAVTRSMRGLEQATKKTSRAREKYNELRKKDGVRASEIKAQGRVLKDALEDEARKAQDLKAAIVDVVEARRSHDDVVRQNAATLRAFSLDAGKSSLRVQRFRDANRDLIDTNVSLRKGFDRVEKTTEKLNREYLKFKEMSRDGSVSSAALAVQVEKVTTAYEAQREAVMGSSDALSAHQHVARQQAERDRRRIMPQSMGQYFARNLGALTPLGTLSPSVLLPVAGVIGSIGEALVTASQSLALLPAAGAAGAAGLGTLVMGLKGFGDALTGMGDPKKFAEALFLLSPNAQQAALAIRSLVDGPLGDLKRATQDALFANVGATIEKLTAALGPTIQQMTTSIATSFNQMFTGISFQMMNPVVKEQITTITTNISSMFDKLTPAVLAFNSAFMKIAETGSGFLPGIADALTGVMTRFDAFIAKAQADGSLQNFMQKGIDAFATISKWLLKFGEDIYKVFGNKSPEEFMDMLNSLSDIAVGLIEVFRAVAKVMETLGPIIREVVEGYGGWENVLMGIIGGGIVVGLYKFTRWAKEAAIAFNWLKPAGEAAAKGIGAASAAGIAGSTAATTAAAQQAAATTAATFATAGKTAGKGFISKFTGALKGGIKGGIGLSVGSAIAIPILDGIDQAINDWIANREKDPGAYKREYDRRKEENIFPLSFPILGALEDIIRNPPWRNQPPAPPQPDGSYYKDLYPLGMNPAEPLGPGDPGYQFPLPNVPLDENGKALTDSEILNKIKGELSPDKYAVDPFVDPVTGQKLNPMLPIGPNGVPEYPAGGVPGTPSIKGPVMPQYNSFGQLTGYGANMVDPEAVFDAQLGVVDRARDLEEAKKDLLAAQQAGILSAEEVNDLERKVLDGKLQLHKALVQLGKAQTGDVEKLKESTNNALGEFGASLDKDFGISKGLSGIAENLTKFLANLAFAPAYGAMRGAQAALGFPGGEGTGYGLAGAAAVSRGYYKGGPMDTGAQGTQAPGYVPSYYQPVGPQAAGVGYGSGPGPVSKSDLRGINLSTIPVAAQQYANNCIDAAAQIILSANGVQLTQDQIERTIARGGSINSLAAGLNKLDPTGGYIPIEASGGSPEALLRAVQDSINKGNGSVLNVAPGSSIGGQNFPAGHFIAVTGYDPATGRINLSDTAQGTMYSVSAAEAFQASRGRGLVAGMGLPSGPPTPRGPVYGPPVLPSPPPPRTGGANPVLPPLPKYATGGEVPIMAHSGEHVLTREDVSAMGGQAAVYNFRRSLHGYETGCEIKLAPFSPDPFDPSNVAVPAPTIPKDAKDIAKPTDLGSLLGAGDGPPAAPPAPPTVAPPAAPPPPPVAPPAVPEPVIPVVPANPATLPETVLPAGTPTPGTVIGAQVEAPAGYGSGFNFTGGGLVGLAEQGLMAAATAGAGMAGGMGGGGGGGGGMGPGGAVGAIASLGMETAIKLAERGIEYGAQVAGIATQGLLETFLPAGGSELAGNNWLTRIVGGIVGAAPAMANLAGGAGAANQSTLPGVGAPTPEQIAAQGMDPNRAQHTGTGAPAGPYTAVNIETYNVMATEDRGGQDLARHQPAPGAR